MIQYIEAVDEFTRDPATGERGYFEYVYLGFVILFTPVALPLYYIGRAAERIGDR